MFNPKLRRLPLATAALVACTGAMAGYSSPDGDFTLSGFGTLGAVKTSTDEALYSYPGQGGGADKSVSINPDTKLAVQGTYKFKPTLSGTAQMMTKYDASGQYIPTFEWAFAKWQALPALTVRAGKMGAPFFMVSDFRDVGYANTTVRPVLDVYGQVPFSAVEGADVSYQANLGSTTLTSTFWTGTTKAKYSSALLSMGQPADPVDIKLQGITGLNLIAEMDNGLTLRAGHAQGKLSSHSPSGVSVEAAAKGLVGFGAVTAADAADVVQAMTVDHTDASFSGLGFAYDQNNIVLGGEFTKRKIKNGYIADTKGWYALAGYRFGSVLPYMSISRLSSTPNTSISQLTIGHYAALLANPLTARAATGAAFGSQAILNSQKQTENTASLGVRWDARSGLAVKTQFDRINIPSGSSGLPMVVDPLKAAAPTLAGGTNNAYLNKRKGINVLSVSLDFVF
ncbi:MAG: hypothetical protein KGL57_11995 [Burkholderiales bacterium]|nr:hypothetical protein [Burkholderiales bacterium]